MFCPQQLCDSELVAFYRNAEVILEILPCEDAAIGGGSEHVEFRRKESGSQFHMTCEEIVERLEAAFRNFKFIHVNVKFFDGFGNTAHG